MSTEPRNAFIFPPIVIFQLCSVSAPFLSLSGQSHRFSVTLSYHDWSSIFKHGKHILVYAKSQSSKQKPFPSPSSDLPVAQEEGWTPSLTPFQPPHPSLPAPDSSRFRVGRRR